uniref:Lanthionine synthetase C-like protein n=1 Tax=Spongospora subterranea TaxID=70186 RepID=A0A0H5QIU3_9EUKA|eukprot:CRZ01913.1 hypothetical protein [Spongospora subterranea]
MVSERYIPNPFIENPSKFNALRIRLDRHREDLIKSLFFRVISLLELSSHRIRQIINRSCSIMILGSRKCQLGSHLYNGNLPGFGFALFRTSIVLKVLKMDLPEFEAIHGLMSRIFKLKCGFDENSLIKTFKPLPSFQDIRQHCRQLAQTAFRLSIDAMESTDQQSNCSGSHRLSTFLESSLGVRIICHELMTTDDDGRSDNQSSDWIGSDFESLIDDSISASLASHARCPNELLYGRAGLLYSLLYLENRVPGFTNGKWIPLIAQKLIESGKSLSNRRNSDWQLLYEFHEQDYLGAAHGLAGILYVLKQVPMRHFDHPHDVNRLFIESGNRIISACQLSTGNFTSRIHPGRHVRDDLVQWCHGSPGIVPLLARIAEDNGNGDGYNASIRMSLEDIWRRGLLTKGLGLCHGIAGNGYAYLRADLDVDHGVNLIRSLAFAETGWESVQDLINVPDNPISLFEGLSGFICFLLDLILTLHSKPILGIPGYDL